MDHKNLHGWGASTTEARISIADDYKRDSTRIWIGDVAACAALYYLVRDWDLGNRIALFAVVLLFLGATRTFIDNSNRNWWLHRLNWDAQVRHEAEQAEEAVEIRRMEAEEIREARRRGFIWPEDAKD